MPAHSSEPDLTAQRRRPFRFTVQASHLSSPSELLPLARRCEELGVSTLTVADHLDDQLAPITAMSTVAATTSRLRVGSLVFANDFRHPAVLAKEIATLDALSGGRVELGVGAGWMSEDYRQAGIDLDSAGVRIERLEEALQVVRRLLDSDAPVHFKGRHYRLDGLVGLPRPVQTPRVPIVVGGGGPKVLALAGRHADVVGLNPNLRAGVIDERAGASATAKATEEKIRWIAAAAGDRFASIELQTRIHMVVITDDRDEVLELFAGGFGLSAEQARQSPHALCGTVDQVVEDLIDRRERFGISAIGLSASALEDMAPVIERLTNA